LRKHDWRLGDSRAEVRVLEPISTEGMTENDIPVLRDRVRDLIANEIQIMRAAA
jgi:1-acyl-sn-glycerol-3-phosphate acyltransferase